MKKLAVFYALFLLLFAIFSYLFIDPNFFYLRFLFTNIAQAQRPITTLLFIVSLSIFYTCYLFFLHASKQKKLSNTQMFSLIGVTALILLFSYPAMLSFDVFNYVATAKVTFLYHENPYIVMPIEFLRDPLLLFMHAANKTALYAPFWIFLTGVPFLLGFGNVLLILFHFKLLAITFYFLTTFLLWKMTKSIYKVVFFALNPLVVIECLVSGHNDIVMMFFLLLSIYFFTHKNSGKSLFFYLCSIGIKYATLILLPVFFISWLKKWGKQQLFIWVTLCMGIIFFLSSFREEIYPWYALWFLVPGTFLVDNTFFASLLISFTGGLLLRYIPFMFLGTYFGPTPLLKIVLMFLPAMILVGGIGVKKIYTNSLNKH